MQIFLSSHRYIRSYQAVQQSNFIFQFFIQLFQGCKQNLAKIYSQHDNHLIKRNQINHETKAQFY